MVDLVIIFGQICFLVKYVLGGIYEETLKKLTQVAAEIGTDLDKTKSRERLVNQQMSKLVTDLRTAHDKLAQAKVRVSS